MTAAATSRPAAGGTRQHRAPHQNCAVLPSSGSRTVACHVAALSEELDVVRAILASSGSARLSVAERSALRLRRRVVKRELVGYLDDEATGVVDRRARLNQPPAPADDEATLIDAAEIDTTALGVIAARALTKVPTPPTFRFLATASQASAVRAAANRHLARDLTYMRLALTRVDGYGAAAQLRGLYAAQLVLDLNRKEPR